MMIDVLTDSNCSLLHLTGTVLCLHVPWSCSLYNVRYKQGFVSDFWWQTPIPCKNGTWTTATILCTQTDIHQNWLPCNHLMQAYRGWQTHTNPGGSTKVGSCVEASLDSRFLHWIISSALSLVWVMDHADNGCIKSGQDFWLNLWL